MTNLKKILKQRAVSQTDFARKGGLSLSLVNAHACRGIKTIRVAQRYATLLNCDPLKLIDIKK
jgi:hypothetical protein